MKQREEDAMETIDRKLVFDTPAAVFVHPIRVVQSAQLSHDDKVVVLRNWKRNLEKCATSPTRKVLRAARRGFASRSRGGRAR
jgi:hypothetical protein